MCLAVPGQIIELTESDPMLRSGIVDFCGVRREINLAFVPDAAEGDYVLVHVGFAITQIDEAEADRVLQALADMADHAEGPATTRGGPK